MNAILAIAGHELRRLFISPLAWIALAAVQLLLAMLFLFLTSLFIEGSVSPNRSVTGDIGVSVLQWASILLLLLTPFLTMRTFSEEYRTGSLNLLLSSPVSLTEITIGKYLGILAFLLIMLSVVSLMPLSLTLGTTLDYGQLASALLGLVLLTGAFAAIGIFISSLTAQQAVAAIVTFTVLFILWIMPIAAQTADGYIASLLTYISILSHHNALMIGIFNSVDVIYYVLVITTFLILTVWRLDAERMYG
jgi:ABC-2 type transport system permease protein